MYRVFIVEDDEKVSGLIAGHLRRYGFKTCTVSDYSGIKADFVRENPDFKVEREIDGRISSFL